MQTLKRIVSDRLFIGAAVCLVLVFGIAFVSELRQDHRLLHQLVWFENQRQQEKAAAAKQPQPPKFAPSANAVTSPPIASSPVPEKK